METQERVYENLLSLRNLKILVSKFEVIDYTLKVIKNPTKYSADEMLKENTYTLKSKPNAIPYLTSYYKKRWFFVYETICG